MGWALVRVSVTSGPQGPAEQGALRVSGSLCLALGYGLGKRYLNLKIKGKCVNWTDHTGSPGRDSGFLSHLEGARWPLGCPADTRSPARRVECGSQASLASSCLAVLVRQMRLGKAVTLGRRYRFPGEPWIRPAGACAVPPAPRASDLRLASSRSTDRPHRTPRAAGQGWRDGPAHLPRAGFGGKPSS